MTYHKEEYTLHNGNKIYALYDEHNVCQATKECIEMLIDLYQQGRTEAIDELSSIVLKELKEIAKDKEYYFNNDNLSLVSSVILKNAEKLKE